MKWSLMPNAKSKKVVDIKEDALLRSQDKFSLRMQLRRALSQALRHFRDNAVSYNTLDIANL
ncbi:unnamed protein product, partial [Amoebophrya sp. A25]|eukprot:GSA25T00022203001.1